MLCMAAKTKTPYLVQQKLTLTLFLIILHTAMEFADDHSENGINDSYTEALCRRCRSFFVYRGLKDDNLRRMQHR